MYASKMTFLLVFNIIIHQIGHRKNKSIPMTDILMQEKKKAFFVTMFPLHAVTIV